MANNAVTVQGQILPRHDDIQSDERSKLPVVQPARLRWRMPLFGGLLLLLAVAGAGYYWWLQRQPTLPPGFAMGNGRLDADEINISTKFAGRVLDLYVDQGDLVKSGQVVGLMDTRDLQAQLKQAEAMALQAQRAVDEAQQNLAQQRSLVLSTQAAAVQAQKTVDEAKANLLQQQTQVKLAQQELDRTTALVPRGIATVELLDQRRQVLNAAIALQSAVAARVSAAEQALISARHNADAAISSRDAAAARVGQAEEAHEAAAHNVEYYNVNIADNTLVAPRDGPIEYRIANIGEVLPAGGKVFTMLDASYVYMDIYLPTADAGRVRIGSEARIVLDAYPHVAIPAKAVYVASEAQFTPKAVETKSERDKLMFRIRIRIDPERLKGYESAVRSGLPGVAYVRVDPKAEWPADLRPGSVPESLRAVTP
ncbi:HlyD family secretion protein [Microvirga sp. Mcv34]|uniref:HlyD family secretion protein n=1 Tax=Microvirga sp. Mcv34 TaxID=2926016 RepID=UPI0021C91208|nr:HlyD family efflux transporter periplasmic adaptor subunit [Microvirga sp. Mcv34]